MAGQLFAVNSLGGFYSANKLSKELRMGVSRKRSSASFAMCGTPGAK
jgi:hypothetical protein